jgi:hypothetical protein
MESAAARVCQLQLRLGIDERCGEDCLFFERKGDPPIGCLLGSAGATPRGIARSLLKKAGRRSR